MHDEHPHPLLAQVPLTVSPFLSLPTAVPLPYSYTSLPSTLPPSILTPPSLAPQSSHNDTGTPATQAATQNPTAYVVSSTGTSATPDQILSSCVALQQHLAKLEADARHTLSDWEERRRKEDMAEKRRLAPGWLDNDVHILKPENVGGSEEGQPSSVEVGVEPTQTEQQQQQQPPPPQWMDLDPQAESRRKEGEELDRVFGGLKV
ncbi:hypothetical protein ACN47E_008116 [Coniothyrium glycines]